MKKGMIGKQAPYSFGNAREQKKQRMRTKLNMQIDMENSVSSADSGKSLKRKVCIPNKLWDFQTYCNRQHSTVYSVI